MREAVVFVHGIWMVGWEMSVLRRRVSQCGFKTYRFHYRSLTDTPRVSAVRLGEFINKIDADVIHLVAHSLGGIVVLHLFESMPLQKPGCVIMLGTPIRGSEIARTLYGNALSRVVLGKSVERGLLGDVPQWKGNRQLGMIAGTKSLGIGRLVGSALDTPNDGTVAVSETRSLDINAHLSVPYTHTSMLLAAPVAAAVCDFLKTGDFEG